jgi:hypothetical protein
MDKPMTLEKFKSLDMNSKNRFLCEYANKMKNFSSRYEYMERFESDVIFFEYYNHDNKKTATFIRPIKQVERYIAAHDIDLECYILDLCEKLKICVAWRQNARK